MRSAPLLRLSLVAVVAFLGTGSPAFAQLTMVESGFTVTTLANDVAKQVEIGVGPDTCIYYGSFEGLKRRCSPTGTATVCDPALFFPVGIAFSTGGSFGNFMYVADYGISNIHRSAGCAATTLFANIDGPGSIAFPPTGSPYGDFLYACEAYNGPISRVSSTGVVTPWATIPTLYLRFGPGGVWGSGLYATSDSLIVRVSSAAVVTSLTSGMIGPEGFDWGFDGDMFATDVSMAQIFRVRSNGTKTLFANLPGAADVAYRVKDNALYVVSNQGGLYRVTRNSGVGVGDGPSVGTRVTVLPNPMRAGCTLRYSVAIDGVSRIRVLDASGRLVRRLSEAWRPAGEQSIVWDGRDDSGARVAPGVYFASVMAAGRESVARVTVTR
jgi:hypothetical protein